MAGRHRKLVAVTLLTEDVWAYLYQEFKRVPESSARHKVIRKQYYREHIMGQVQINKDGQPVILPWEEVTGQQLKEYTGVAPDRLVTVVENGQTRAVGDQERVTLAPGTFVSDAPRFRNGGDLPASLSADRCVEVVISEADHTCLLQHLLREGDPREQHAFLLAGLCDGPRGTRLLVRDIIFARQEDFLQQTSSYIELAPAYYLAATDRCHAKGLHLIECHSHPFADKRVAFSSIDINNEREKFAWYGEKWPWMRAATLVFGRASVDGHWYDHPSRTIRAVSRLRIVGPSLSVRPTTGSGAQGARVISDLTFHRQELAFGPLGQKRLRDTRVAIVGCGGLGSVLCEQLVYLGVRNFVLADPDRVEESNLNRLVFAVPEDATLRRSKVEVMARGIKAVRPGAAVDAISGSIVDPAVQARVKDVDLLIAGTDCDGARLVCNDLAVRYLLPFVDLGTGINVEDGVVREAGGQVWMTLPGGGCLYCAGIIDAARAREGLMNDIERRRHVARGYGTNTPQPAVLFLNSTVASLAVGEIVKLVTGLAAPQGLVLYDALAPAVRALSPPARNPECPVCCREALYAMGDEAEAILPIRAVPAASLTLLPERAVPA